MLPLTAALLRDMQSSVALLNHFLCGFYTLFDVVMRCQ